MKTQSNNKKKDLIILSDFTFYPKNNTNKSNPPLKIIKQTCQKSKEDEFIDIHYYLKKMKEKLTKSIEYEKKRKKEKANSSKPEQKFVNKKDKVLKINQKTKSILDDPILSNVPKSKYELVSKNKHVKLRKDNECLSRNLSEKPSIKTYDCPVIDYDKIFKQDRSIFKNNQRSISNENNDSENEMLHIISNSFNKELLKDNKILNNNEIDITQDKKNNFSKKRQCKSNNYENNNTKIKIYKVDKSKRNQNLYLFNRTNKSNDSKKLCEENDTINLSFLNFDIWRNNKKTEKNDQLKIKNSKFLKMEKELTPLFKPIINSRLPSYLNNSKVVSKVDSISTVNKTITSQSPKRKDSKKRIEIMRNLRQKYKIKLNKTSDDSCENKPINWRQMLSSINTISKSSNTVSRYKINIRDSSSWQINKENNVIYKACQKDFMLELAKQKVFNVNELYPKKYGLNFPIRNKISENKSNHPSNA